MNCENVNDVSILTLLELLFNSNDKNIGDDEQNMCSRGLKNTNSRNKKELENQLLKKKKRDKLIRNIESLKDIIQEKNEELSIIQLTKIINEITSRDQKLMIIKHLTVSDEHQHQDRFTSGMTLVPRCTEPESIKDTSLNSDHTNSINISPKPSDQYLIHKGIYYCRILLSKFYLEKNNTIIRELKEKNILNYVLNEQIDNAKSYLMILVDNYPDSYNEILFILNEDEESILRSPIFALFAEKNINLLYEFLINLSNDGNNKNRLSQACDESNFHGSYVSDIIKRNRNSNQSTSGVKIQTFLQRYKKL